MIERLGFSGGVARQFQDNALTPLLAVTALLLGVNAQDLIEPIKNPDLIDDLP